MVKCHTASQFPQLVSMKRGRILLFRHLTVFLLHAFMPGWQHCCEDAWPWSYVAVLQSIRGAEDRVQLVSMFLLISHLLHRVDWSIGACGQLAHWHLCSRKVNHIATGSSDRIKKKISMIWIKGMTNFMVMAVNLVHHNQPDDLLWSLMELAASDWCSLQPYRVHKAMNDDRIR